jgi:hypothetical protein
MRVRHRTFRSSFGTWDELFTQASQFASEIGPTYVINISHSVSGADGTVTVWYWEGDEE